MTSDLIIHVTIPRKFRGAERSGRCTHTCGAFENTRRFADLWDLKVITPPLPRGYTNSLLWMNTYVENYCLIIKENLGNKI